MAYPVQYQTDYRERQSRLTTFFRWLLVIPWAFVGIFWGLLGYVGVICGWFGIVFTGRYPDFAYDLTAKYLRYSARVNGWASLLTDEFPPFDADDHPDYPIRLAIPPAQPVYSRWKAALRLILTIPVIVMAWLFGVLVGIVGFVVWIVVVVTGKNPKGLWDLLRMGLAYLTLAGVYYSLVTETYPPISAEDDGAPAPVVPPPPAAPPLA